MVDCGEFLEVSLTEPENTMIFRLDPVVKEKKEFPDDSMWSPSSGPADLLYDEQ